MLMTSYSYLDGVQHCEESTNGQKAFCEVICESSHVVEMERFHVIPVSLERLVRVSHSV